MPLRAGPCRPDALMIYIPDNESFLGHKTVASRFNFNCGPTCKSPFEIDRFVIGHGDIFRAGFAIRPGDGELVLAFEDAVIDFTLSITAYCGVRPPVFKEQLSHRQIMGASLIFRIKSKQLNQILSRMMVSRKKK